MPAFRPENARLIGTTIVIHDFDQWSNPMAAGTTPGGLCFCTVAAAGHGRESGE